MQLKLQQEGVFQLLGVSKGEEAAYRALLSCHTASGADVGKLIALSSRKAERLLIEIAAKGLATHSPETPPRFIATPPEFAIEALISESRAKLDRARAIIPELVERAARERLPPSGERGVEVISSREALAEVLMQVRMTTTQELIGFQRPPLLVGRVTDPFAQSGILVRSISDADWVALPGAIQELQRVMALGEEARVCETLPLKMIISDRRIAVVPLDLHDKSGRALLIRTTSIVKALSTLFDMIWEQSTPIAVGGLASQHINAPRTGLTAECEQLLPLLAAGISDKVIAHAQEISEATLTRRLSTLMKVYNCRTRFQLGWQAALHASNTTSPAR